MHCGAERATGAPQTFFYNNKLQFSDPTTNQVLLEIISTAGDGASIEWARSSSRGTRSIHPNTRVTYSTGTFDQKLNPTSTPTRRRAFG